MFAYIAVLLLVVRVSFGALDLYVSNHHGSDSNHGLSSSESFKTLNKAQQTIRHLKKNKYNGHIPNGGIIVNIDSGLYEESLYFTAYDSGDSINGYVTWKAMNPNEKVTMSAGMKINVTSFYECTSPFNANLDLLCANLSSLGITNVGSMLSGDLKDCQHNKTELFYNDIPQILARWPDINYDTQLPQYTTITNAINQTSFEYNNANSNAQNWLKESDPWLHGYWTQDWADEYAQMSKVVETGSNKYDIYSKNLATPKTNARFYVVNMLSELDSKTEYYIDKASMILYWLAPDAQNNLIDNVVVSVNDYVITLASNASYLSFQDISISHSKISGVYTQGQTANTNPSVNHINITNCLMNGHGNNGIDMNGNELLINNNVVQYVGCNGIMAFGGDHYTLKSSNNQVLNNTIWNFGRWKRTYKSGIRWGGVGNTYSHNNISFGPHQGFLGGGNEADGILGGCNNVFEYNWVSNVSYEVSDSGAFYTCGQDNQGWINRGNVFRHNQIQNVRNLVPVTIGGTASIQAIYLDDQISGWLMENNTLINCQKGFFIGGGRRNVVKNNYCLDVDYCTHIDNRGMGWQNSACKPPDGVLWEGLYSVNYTIPPWSTAYPELTMIPQQEPCVPVFNVIENNEYCGSGTHFADYSDQDVAAWNDTASNNTYKCH